VNVNVRFLMIIYSKGNFLLMMIDIVEDFYRYDLFVEVLSNYTLLMMMMIKFEHQVQLL